VASLNWTEFLFQIHLTYLSLVDLYSASCQWLISKPTIISVKRLNTFYCNIIKPRNHKPRNQTRTHVLFSVWQYYKNAYFKIVIAIVTKFVNIVLLFDSFCIYINVEYVTFMQYNLYYCSCNIYLVCLF